jgi:hypothetical protein
MKTLQRPMDSISFAEREVQNGRPLSNKCGRDALYYVLHYHFPQKFNAHAISAREIDAKHLFGLPVPKWLAWTQIQFFTVAQFLKTQGLQLYINKHEISSYFSFVSNNLFSQLSYDEGIAIIKQCIDNNETCAVDIRIGTSWLFLLDHVMFAYGYDDENVYVFDTLTVPALEYERLSDENHFYKLPFSVIRKRWSKFGRVWEIRKISEQL